MNGTTPMSAFRIHPRKRMPPTPTDAPIYLDQVYGTCSLAKRRAYCDCKYLCDSVGGKNMRITGHNCMTFSVSFDFVNPDNGRPMRAIITRNYNHAYYIGECD